MKQFGHYDQRCMYVVVGTISSTEKLLAGAIAGDIACSHVKLV